MRQEFKKTDYGTIYYDIFRKSNILIAGEKNLVLEGKVRALDDGNFVFITIIYKISNGEVNGLFCNISRKVRTALSDDEIAKGMKVIDVFDELFNEILSDAKMDA